MLFCSTDSYIIFEIVEAVPVRQTPLRIFNAGVGTMDSGRHFEAGKR
jgi:hypothetical protein